MKEDDLSLWVRESSTLHADCRVYSILREEWNNPREAVRGEFFVMDVGDWVVAIALTDRKTCVLVRQFRFGSAELSWELPAGLIDQGEDPLHAALRELYEESGYTGGSPRIIGSVDPNPAIQRNHCYFVLVEGAYQVGQGDPGPHEFFAVREVPLEEVFEWANNGTIRHSIVHSALYFLRHHLEDQDDRSSDSGVR